MKEQGSSTPLRRHERNTSEVYHSEYRVFPLSNEMVEKVLNSRQSVGSEDIYLSYKETEDLLEISREQLVECIAKNVFEMVKVEEFILPKRSSVVDFYEFSLAFRKAWQQRNLKT